MMPTRRNKTLTMIFGLLPGAGHMFMGFMHLGVSYMTLFFGAIALIAFVDNLFYYAFEVCVVLLPIIWCYAFFDCLNKCYSSDEVFYTLEDHFLFSEGSSLPKFRYNFALRLGRYARLAIGWLLTVSGVILLAQRILNIFTYSGMLDYDSYIYRGVREFLEMLPRTLAALVIIVIGLWLIFGKRKELKEMKALIEPQEEIIIQDLEEEEKHE